MILYHPSDRKFNIVKVKYFGEHYYTLNDMKISPVPRTFWYNELPISENRFKSSQFIYVAKVNKKRIYDLRKDKNNLLEKFRYRGLHGLLLYLKKRYLGVIYQVQEFNLVAIFKDIKPIRRIEK